MDVLWVMSGQSYIMVSCSVLLLVAVPGIYLGIKLSIVCAINIVMNRDWKILNSNIRRINSDKKRTAISNKNGEIGCAVLYLQETKRDSFDLAYLGNFSPRRFNQYA